MEIICGTCKHFYNIKSQKADIHAYCKKGACYLCATYKRSCAKYERGEVPIGVERGTYTT